MADEFTINISMTYASTVGVGLNHQFSPDSISITQTNPGFHEKTQIIGGATTIEVLEQAGRAGILFIQNLDAENSVTWGSTLREFYLPAGKIAGPVIISSSTQILNISPTSGTPRIHTRLGEF